MLLYNCRGDDNRCRASLKMAGTAPRFHVEPIQSRRNTLAFVPFENCLKVEQVFLWDSQYVENVFHVEKDSPWTTTDMQNQAIEFINAWDTLWQANMASTLQLVNIKCTDLTTEFSPGIEYSTGLPLTGSSGAAALPNVVTVAVKWITALRGRSYRGRTFHIGLLESHVLDNQITTAALTLLQAYYLQIWGGVPIAGADLVVASRIQGGVERETGVMTPIIGFQIDRGIDTQRRRLPGRGR